LQPQEWAGRYPASSEVRFSGYRGKQALTCVESREVELPFRALGMDELSCLSLLA